MVRGSCCFSIRADDLDDWAGERGLLADRVQFRKFASKAAGEDREPAPCFRIEILVVDMERWGIPLPLPLIATPKLKKPLHPSGKLSTLISGEFHGDRIKHFLRRTAF